MIVRGIPWSRIPPAGNAIAQEFGRELVWSTGVYTPTNGKATLSATGASIAAAPLGYALKTDGTAGYADLPSAQLHDTRNFTYFCLISSTQAGSDKWIISEGNTADANPIAGLILDTNAARFFVRNTAGSAANITSSKVINDGLPHAIVGTYDGTTARLFVDGVELGSAALASAATATNTTTLGALHRSSYALFFSGNIYVAGGIRRAIARDEAERLSRNLLGRVFAPMIRRIPTEVAAAGGISGTIAATLSAFTFDGTSSTTITGSMAQTLSAYVAAIAGTTAVVGAMASTIDDAGSSISGAPTVNGALSTTLSDNTSAISGTAGDISGTLSAILDSLTSAISATTTVVGTIAVTLANFTSQISQAAIIVYRSLRGLGFRKKPKGGA